MFVRLQVNAFVLSHLNFVCTCYISKAMLAIWGARKTVCSVRTKCPRLVAASLNMCLVIKHSKVVSVSIDLRQEGPFIRSGTGHVTVEPIAHRLYHTSTGISGMNALEFLICAKKVDRYQLLPLASLFLPCSPCEGLTLGIYVPEGNENCTIDLATHLPLYAAQINTSIIQSP